MKDDQTVERGVDLTRLCRQLPFDIVDVQLPGRARAFEDAQARDRFAMEAQDTVSVTVSHLELLPKASPPSPPAIRLAAAGTIKAIPGHDLPHLASVNLARVLSGAGGSSTVV